MANVLSKTGDKRLLDAAVDSDAFDTLHFFQNDVVPTVDSVAADFDEADFSGYPGPTALVWAAAVINGDGKGEIEADAVTIEHNGGATSNTIYGVFVLSAVPGLTYAERFDAPVIMANSPDKITYTPRFTMVSE